MLSVGDWDLEMHLSKPSGYGELLGVDFANEDWWLAWCLRALL